MLCLHACNKNLTNLNESSVFEKWQISYRGNWKYQPCFTNKPGQTIDQSKKITSRWISNRLTDAQRFQFLFRNWNQTFWKIILKK